MYITIDSRGAMKKSINELVEYGEFVIVTINSDPKSEYYALKEQFESAGMLKKRHPGFICSPRSIISSFSATGQ